MRNADRHAKNIALYYRSWHVTARHMLHAWNDGIESLR